MIRPRVDFPVAAIVATIAAAILGFDYLSPVGLLLLLSLPICALIFMVGILLTWRLDFLTASAICGALTVIVVLLWSPSDFAKTMQTLPWLFGAYVVPLAVIQLLFFRRGATFSRMDLQKDTHS